MRLNDRPKAGVLWLLGFGLVAATLVVVELTSWQPGADQKVPWGLVALVAGAALLTYWLVRNYYTEPFDRAIVGVATIVVVWLAAFALVMAILKPWDWRWLQFAIVAAVAAGALVLVANEWSQRWLLRTIVVLGLLVVALVVRVGYLEVRSSVVGDAIDEAVTSKEALADEHEQRQAAILEEKNKANRALADAYVAVPENFRAAAAQLHETLLPLAVDETKARHELVGLLALGLPAGEQPQILTLRDKATAAFDASTKQSQLPDDAEFRDALGAACAAARSVGETPRGCATATTDPAPPGGENLATALRRLRIELAYYRFAVTQNPADKAAAESAVAAEPEDFDLSMWSSLSAGPEAIVGSVNSDNPLRFVPGPVFWFLLGVAALGGLRALLKQNSRHVAGPVQIDYGGDLAGELRIALLSNISTPAAAPGATVTQSITDLSSLAGPAAGFIGGVTKAVNTVLARTPGYIVEAEVVPPPKAPTPVAEDEPDGTDVMKPTPAQKEQPTRVLVRVITAASRESFANESFEDVVPELAMRSGGFWAAGLLLDQSTRIPSWASWNRETARAVGTAKHPTLAQREEAVRTAPSSGLLLQLLGAQLELEGRALDAIGVYARAVAAHPRYLEARYRLAVSMAMAGRDPDKVWHTASLADRAAVLDALRQAGDRIGVDMEPLTHAEVSRDDFYKVGRGLLDTVEQDASWWKSVIATLRRADRDDLLRPARGGPWRRWKMDRLRAESARLIYGDPDPATVRKMEKEASNPTRPWQLAYNLACYYARRSETTALDWLDRCLIRPDVEQVSVVWVKKDPDLGPISTHPRFMRFCAQLEERP